MMEDRIAGAPTEAELPFEKKHREVAKWAAEEGFVLLKNEKILPIPTSRKVALYGSGAVKTIRGGIGSGDVNARETVNIFEGMEKAGYTIVNEGWREEYLRCYEEARQGWREQVLSKMEKENLSLWDVYTNLPFQIPVGPDPCKEEADVAIFVLSRTAGEGMDRRAVPGDWYLSPQEEAFLKKLNRLYPNLVLLLNTGGMVDLSFTKELSNLKGLLYISQPGMEAGNAVADVLSGKVTPSGKLTDTWAKDYADYPNSASFSSNNGNVEKEYYEEGMFVGYRYFDTFQVAPLYGFGYGLSYTTFSWVMERILMQSSTTSSRKEGYLDQTMVRLTVNVTNTGRRAGKEVIQVYAACPPTEGGEAFRKLVGYKKTGLLQPGQTQRLLIRIPVRSFSTYDENLPGWVIREGVYGLYVGNSLQASQPTASVLVQERLIVEKTKNVCPLSESFRELHPDMASIRKRREEMLSYLTDCPSVDIPKEGVDTREVVYEGGYKDAAGSVLSFVKSLSKDQLVLLATGDLAQGWGSQVGDAGTRVPGSAAETSGCAREQGLDSLVLADGPAGLRLSKKYWIVDGVPQKNAFEEEVEEGLFNTLPERTKGEPRYQYCTAFPVGTCLAMSWDDTVLEEVGMAVAEEMQAFHVDLWLAPGMNIHRNPLCGRNFEYYSEDPLVSGKMAASMTRGVQSVPGCGVTIKHFACNNQEDNRKNSNSILSERVLREIYLKGFEIAVQLARPVAIMTSYNLLNGVHAANSNDLCTKVARNEWGFEGLIMTDWTTTNDGPSCTASGCMRAGNDLVMPGQPMDHENLRLELEKKTLSQRDLRRSICRLVTVIWRLKGKPEGVGRPARETKSPKNVKEN